MMKLGTQTGSLMNHMMADNAKPAPAVGMGATICMWTDRKAATIVKVTATQVHVQEDIATRTDKNGMSDAQTYDYAPDPSAPVRVFRLTKRGLKDKSGSHLSVGHRSAFYDFSF